MIVLPKSRSYRTLVVDIRTDCKDMAKQSILTPAKIPVNALCWQFTLVGFAAGNTQRRAGDVFVFATSSGKSHLMRPLTAFLPYPPTTSPPRPN